VIEQVHGEHPEMSIEKLCSLMGVSRSWYYKRPSATEKVKKDVELRDAIERIVLEFSGYGYRRVTAALRREGWNANHKRVLRIMREESLLCQLKRRFVPTTDSAHALGRYPNLIKDIEIDALDQVWISDITYV
jgi:putative transposase